MPLECETDIPDEETMDNLNGALETFGLVDVVRLIAENKIQATAMQFPKIMARQAAEFADQWFKGKRDFPQKIPVAVELVTPDNVSEYRGYGAKDGE